MSKMGQELDERLDENKYELYEALRELVEVIDDKTYDIDSFTTQPARRVLAKVEDSR